MRGAPFTIRSLSPFCFCLTSARGRGKADSPERMGSDPLQEVLIGGAARSVASDGTGGDARACWGAVVARTGARQRLLDARLDAAFGLAADGGEFGDDEVA